MIGSALGEKTLFFQKIAILGGGLGHFLGFRDFRGSFGPFSGISRLYGVVPPTLPSFQQKIQGKPKKLESIFFPYEKSVDFPE